MTHDIVTTSGVYAGHDGNRVFVQIGGTTDTIYFEHPHHAPHALDMHIGMPCEVRTNMHTSTNTLHIN